MCSTLGSTALRKRVIFFFFVVYRSFALSINNLNVNLTFLYIQTLLGELKLSTLYMPKYLKALWPLNCATPAI